MSAPPLSEPRVEIINDLVYASPGGRDLAVDLYLLSGAQERRPTILWLHGGGWRRGSRKQAPDLARYFAARGFAMASIDYRLSDEAIFPAAVEDVNTAVRWLKIAAPLYGLDPDRVGLWGSSAGGHLAALVAAAGPGRFAGSEYSAQNSRVAAVAVGYPPIDFLQMDAQREPGRASSADPETLRLPPGHSSTDPDSFESRFLGAPIETCPERVRAANPVTYVEPGLPPFLILHGLSDAVVPPAQSSLLYEALAAHGNRATLVLVEGLGHAFFSLAGLDDLPREVSIRSTDEPPVEASRRILDLIGGWFHRELGPARS